jgi:hypothetical protein
MLLLYGDMRINILCRQSFVAPISTMIISKLFPTGLLSLVLLVGISSFTFLLPVKNFSILGQNFQLINCHKNNGIERNVIFNTIKTCIQALSLNG